LLAAFMSRRANAAWGLVVLTALIALMAEAPSDPYLLESLQFWEQGRFVNLYGLAQWVGWLWPFAALAWLLYGVTQSDRPPPPRSPPGGRSEGQAGRDGTHERPVGGNPETTIP
jgi:apolipoprotein N-acyltransferase